MKDSMLTEEEWFTLDDISINEENTDRLYCISVDAPERQFIIGENIAVPTKNSDSGREEDAAKAEAAMIIGSVARLGRAAGVHLCIATQRPDAKLIAGETKANLGARICCGTVGSTASSMILDSGEGTRIRSNPKGRIYVQIFSHGDHAQGFFADNDWLDNYFQDKGLNPDGSPLSKPKSRLAKIADMSEFEGADLDAREGVDNKAAIEKIRSEEQAGIYRDSSEDDDDEPMSDDDYEEIDPDLIEELFSGAEDIETEEDTPAPPQNEENRPALMGKPGKSKNHRHEDDWDTGMDELMNLQEEDD